VSTTKTTGIALLSHAPRDPEREAERKPLSLTMYRRMFQYATPYRRLLTGLVLTVVLRAAQIPLLALVYTKVINGPISNNDLHGVLLGTLAYLAMALFTQITLYHRTHLALLLGEGVVHDLRNHLFEHLQTLNMGFFNKTKLGRIISRMTSDAESLRVGIQDAVFVTIVAAIQMIVAAIIMIFQDSTLFLLVFATSPFYYLAYHYFRKWMSKVHREVQESYSRLTSSLAESVAGIRVIQGFVRQDVNARMWNALVADHANYNLNVTRASGTFGPVLELMNTIVSSLLFLYGGWRVLQPGSTVTVADLMVFLFLLGNVLDPIASLGVTYNQATAAMAGAERVFRMLDRKPDIVDAPEAVPLPPIQGHVEFKGLWFEYEPGRPVLRDIHFTAQPGQTVALVGHTGSGKTSIINLIARFYLPTRGQLLIDGYDITQVQGQSLHEQMGIVLQQNFLFTGTVRDNIRMGKPGSTDAQVLDAARRLDVLDLLEALPQGLDTQVGERGGSLSLGQRQVVCFTRAMLANPRILILDEATSSVDTITEARITKALNLLLKGRTCFVVAHRLSTIRHADLVLVLDHGKIIERGQHEDMLAAGGVYAEMYTQFVRATES
jgi:ATP-binding cassette subfamily B protein